MRPTGRTRFGDGQVLQCRVELEGVAPTVWRRLLVSERASLQELHDVIAHAFRHEPDDEYRIVVDGISYHDAAGAPVPRRAADRVALADVGLHPGARFIHIADSLGEPWRHVVTVEQVTARRVGQRLPACIDAARAAPPEHCNGADGYRELLDALRDPFNPRAAEVRSWLVEDFDPAYADVPRINAELAKIPRHRPAA